MKEYQDHYFKKAKKENYPARSVYKLMEIDKRFHIFEAGQKVLDLGAAPGSWTLFSAKKVGPKGYVLGVDIQTTETVFPENVTYLQADVFEDSTELMDAMEKHLPYDLIISDMAPKTIGVRFADQVNSLELCERARDLIPRRLKKGGHFVVKIFDSADVRAYTDSLRKMFGKVKNFKPKSSREESMELFIVALGFRGIEG
ncbi:RlmE family RNA methyltransferase [Maridesulfovibrio ferrireducens]|uniref:Ribosomal RNA large subunit methyltransferase E n=1 Tax=Maridesulfovibrio ferrireducens TaxID=246191 RepID=A0A1G9FIW6_9BACT|nr:RlmE family RNA methyltransferase [Maridesulfovibrio ferrireducens]MBI9112314.1 RlmE family RNA methyltransferase [Maridesulfovibrio ferrireducens]SDK88340.1 23S rRNA (uridine2552-2'-O)-methyltransferase [Maridesulfovibrio ferrireducens]